MTNWLMEWWCDPYIKMKWLEDLLYQWGIGLLAGDTLSLTYLSWWSVAAMPLAWVMVYRHLSFYNFKIKYVQYKISIIKWIKKKSKLKLKPWIKTSTKSLKKLLFYVCVDFSFCCYGIIQYNKFSKQNFGWTQTSFHPVFWTSSGLMAT